MLPTGTAFHLQLILGIRKLRCYKYAMHTVGQAELNFKLELNMLNLTKHQDIQPRHTKQKSKVFDGKCLIGVPWV